jgi:hypothetical protein
MVAFTVSIAAAECKACAKGVLFVFEMDESFRRFIGISGIPFPSFFVARLSTRRREPISKFVDP